MSMARVTLWETGWVVVREGIPGQATKADVLQVASSLLYTPLLARCWPA